MREEIVKEVTDRIMAVVPARKTRIRPDDDLLNIPGFDSLVLLEALVWLEGRYSIQIPDEELQIDQFSSVAKITDYVQQHTADS